MTEENRNLTREQLQLFQALWEKKTLSGAALSLGMHLPKASRILKQLREIAGDELFVRMGGEMHPTAAAERMHPSVEGAARAMDEILKGRAFDPASLQRTFTVLVHSQPLSRFGPLMLNAMKDAAPRCRIAFLPLGENWQEILGSSRADLAVLPDANIPSSYRQLVVSSCSYVIALRKGHPLTGLSDPTAADLRKYPECVSTGSRLRGRAFLHDSRGFSNGFVLPDALAAPSFLKATDAWMVTCRLMFEQLFQKFYGLDAIPFPEGFSPFPEKPRVRIVWHARFDSDPAEQWFRGFIANSVRRVCGQNPELNPYGWAA